MKILFDLSRNDKQKLLKISQKINLPNQNILRRQYSFWFGKQKTIWEYCEDKSIPVELRYKLYRFALGLYYVYKDIEDEEDRYEDLIRSLNYYLYIITNSLKNKNYRHVYMVLQEELPQELIKIGNSIIVENDLVDISSN